jgi:hypothetical protein
MRLRLITASTVVLAVTAAAMLALAGSVAAVESALPAGNLVKNPGAESPIGGEHASSPPVYPAAWESEEVTDPKGQPGRPVQSIRYGPHQFVLTPAFSAAIGGGKTFFSGGYAADLSRASQMIDVSRAAVDIDAGGVKACLSAYLGGGLDGAAGQDNSTRADLQFLGETGAARGQLSIGPVTRGHRIPQLAVRCQRGALLAAVTPADAVRTQRVRFQVRGAKGQKVVTDARAPYSARVPMSGITGRLTVTATLTQAGSGNVVLSKKSRRC